MKQPPISNARIAVWVVLAAATMMFVGFTSTLLARREAADWMVGPLPSVLWFSTLALLASSGLVEWARSGAKRADLDKVRRGLAGAAALALVFVLGQWLAWQQLMAGGVGVQSSPHSGFFYILTAAHALHVLGGLISLAVMLRRVFRQPNETGRAGAGLGAAEHSVSVFATYWHFMAGLWIFLFAILFWI